MILPIATPTSGNKIMISNYNDAERSKNEGDRLLVSPEDYCYYGVEGNPVFTSCLRRDKIHILDMLPRPVRHFYFLTQHAGAGVDGPTMLYLDTINQKHNYWGSSMIPAHADAHAEVLLPWGLW
jgi:hypothetical protein